MIPVDILKQILLGWIMLYYEWYGRIYFLSFKVSHLKIKYCIRIKLVLTTCILAWRHTWVRLHGTWKSGTYLSKITLIGVGSKSDTVPPGIWLTITIPNHYKFSHSKYSMFWLLTYQLNFQYNLFIIFIGKVGSKSYFISIQRSVLGMPQTRQSDWS